MVNGQNYSDHRCRDVKKDGQKWYFFYIVLLCGAAAAAATARLCFIVVVDGAAVIVARYSQPYIKPDISTRKLHDDLSTNIRK